MPWGRCRTLLVHLARAGYIAIDGLVRECEVVAGGTDLSTIT